MIENNIFDVKGKAMNNSSGIFLELGGAVDVTVNHNTGLASGLAIALIGGFEGAAVAERFNFINNLISCNQYGVVEGNGRGAGVKGLQASCKDWTFSANAIIGVSSNSKLYPPHNYFPLKIQNVGFADYEKGNYKLTGSYQNAGTDGKDIGADIEAVAKATAGVLTGR